MLSSLPDPTNLPYSSTFCFLLNNQSFLPLLALRDPYFLCRSLFV
jgi:hypothetical protein